LTIDDLTATTVAGLDTSSGTGNEQIFTDGEGGLVARGYVQKPVAFENLVLWYPFDVSPYAGMTEYRDDATDGLAGAANTTGFDLNDGGDPGVATGAGVFDINAGDNSDAVDLPPNTSIQTNTVPAEANIDDAFSVCLYAKLNSTTERNVLFTFQNAAATDNFSIEALFGEYSAGCFDGSLISEISGGTVVSGTYKHIAYTKPVGRNAQPSLYVDGNAITDTGNGTVNTAGADRLDFGVRSDGFNGLLDDARFYNTELSASDVQTIFDNTDPNQNP